MTRRFIAALTSVHEPVRETRVQKVNGGWGEWGSNPRPADYENYGLALPTLYLHGYHRAVRPMALIALYARMARSTNRSTTTTASD
jgi:hypothetical protein